ncbi:transposase, partial [Peptococcus niger]
ETSVYFAHPYSSWERGQNERYNRIFRNYVPKRKSIEFYSGNDILSFADSMNDSPRRVLSYRTPNEMFEEQLDRIYALNF